ncbi:Dabb family protein [Acetobacter estunensis]|uniref:Dabb family protein n=1 Tax=Acetobacter estunensis TaxID=104097 RepID=A0A967EJ74_9PROT|nr:Dabb family protein [Acetobacter estunensis]NHO54459.1 Dabb family protein [Acetobacter estunensis]
MTASLNKKSLLRPMRCVLTLLILAPFALSGAHAAPLSDAAIEQQALAGKVGTAQYTAPDFHPGIVRHMVMFRFRPETTQAQKAEVTRRFLALAKASRRSNGAPVIASLEAGPQNSGENADEGLQYGYLVTFRSEGDRNFYVGRPVVTDAAFLDPAHDAFKTFAGPFLEKAVVFDFTVSATQ